MLASEHLDNKCQFFGHSICWYYIDEMDGIPKSGQPEECTAGPRPRRSPLPDWRQISSQNISGSQQFQFTFKAL
jgi:hypothetical protein